jgi:hypothetical protein
MSEPVEKVVEVKEIPQVLGRDLLTKTPELVPPLIDMRVRCGRPKGMKNQEKKKPIPEGTKKEYLRAHGRALYAKKRPYVLMYQEKSLHNCVHNLVQLKAPNLLPSDLVQEFLTALKILEDKN